MDRPLRFCMITTFYPPYNFGGDGIFVSLLSNELAKRGHTVEVIHCADSYRLFASEDPTQSRQEHSNVTVHRLESPYGFLSPLATQQTGIPILKSAHIRQILNRGFDVIHYHNISLVGGPKILEYGQGIKLYTMHEYWLVCPTHTLFKFNREPCTSRQCLACSLTYLRPPQLWRWTGLLESALRHVDRFISPSQFGADIHHKMGLEAPIAHIPNFVQPPDSVLHETNASIDQEMEMPYFFFAGRLEKLKGLQTLIPVFRNHRKARLLIAGKGSYESELRKMAGGSANIRFLGFQSGAKLQALYRNATAVIVPSVCYELFSLVILEAFREGVPAIVRDLGGMPELIKKSGGGFVYASEEELITAIDRLLADRSYRDRIGAAGQQAYRQYWTPEIHIEQYLTLIREIANNRTKPSKSKGL